MTRLGAFDRRVGNQIRGAVAGRAALGRGLDIAARALGPAFRGVVALLIVLPRERRIGVRAGVAATIAALTAGRLRLLIGRPRPADDTPGFPSRHAASATAIVATVSRSHPRLGAVLGLAAAAGLAGRVTSARHDPADIASGAVVGAVSSDVVRRVSEAAPR